METSSSIAAKTKPPQVRLEFESSPRRSVFVASDLAFGQSDPVAFRVAERRQGDAARARDLGRGHQGLAAELLRLVQGCLQVRDLHVEGNTVARVLRIAAAAADATVHPG